MNTNDEENQMKQKCRYEMKSETDPIKLIRLQCLARGSSGIRGLGRLFRIMDDDRSKSLNLEEMINGLHDYQLTLSKEQVHKLFNDIDVDNTGTVSFDEFLIALRPPMSSSRKSVIMKAFDKLNKTGDEFITVEDLQGTYDVSQHPKFKNGEWTKDRCLRQFLDTFDVGGVKDGKITKEEFINYYSGVSASIDEDAYFDLMMRNAYKF